jgi:hypothetical protein
MTKTHTKKTIYLAGPLAEALRKRPDLDFTRICQEALKYATGLSTMPIQNTPEVVGEIARFEDMVQNTRTTLQKIARLAASQAGMVVLTEEESETYRQILDIGINQFIHRTKKEAVEAHKAELEKQKLAKQKAKKKNKAEKLNEHEEPVRCVDCNDPFDVPCRGCGAPLCWTCWAGKNPDAQATEMCQKCLGGEPPNTAGSQESSTITT